jgi:hypothetical protein
MAESKPYQQTDFLLGYFIRALGAPAGIDSILWGRTRAIDWDTGHNGTSASTGSSGTSTKVLSDICDWCRTLPLHAGE